MSGVRIEALKNAELDAICGLAILLFGIISIFFMRRLKKEISRFMIIMACLYIVAIICDAVHQIYGSYEPSLYMGRAGAMVLLGYIIQMLAAQMWLAYVQNRTIFNPAVRKYSVACGFIIDASMIIIHLFAYINRGGIMEWENDIGFPGLTIRVTESFILMVYFLTLIYAINGISMLDWAQKRRSFAMMTFSTPIIITSVLQIVTNRNFKCIGWMIAFILYVYIRMNDLGREQNRELVHFLNIMDSIKDEYLSIYYVNLNTNKFEPYVVSDIITEEYEDIIKEGNYDAYMEAYTDKTVYSPDVDKYRKAVNRDVIKSRLQDAEDFVFDYRVYRNGEAADYQLHCWKAKEEGELVHVVMGYKDISDEKKREYISYKNEVVFKSLVEGFEYVGYIDFGNETLEEYHISKNFEYFFDILGESDSRKRFDLLFKHGMTKEQYDSFCKFFDKDKVLDELEESGSYNLECVMNLSRGPRYYSVKALADKKNPEAVVIGITDINDQIRAEIEKKERAKEREYSIQLETTIAERTAELHEKAKSLNQINEDIIELLGNITEARDVESGEHIRRVKGFTNILARRIMDSCPEYGLDEEKIALITSASALHDIGKIMIPDAILRKPGKFTAEEFEVMKTHCEKGCEILKKAPQGWDESYLNFSMEICRCHHEKWDGKGYPQGLKGDDIPISAQIVSVADCFDALTTKRIYKDAYTAQQAYDMILNGECGAFSPKILDAFKQVKDEFIAQFGSVQEEHATANAVNTYALADIKILLVEDNKLTRKITTEILEEEGAQVVAVADGKSALEDIGNKDNVDYDAILMDLMLPDMDGWEVAKKIKESDIPRAVEVPIIAISSSGDEFIKQKAFEAGMVAYIPKPVSVTALTKILIKSMRSEQNSLKKRLEEVVKRANNDPLTGVKNITAYTEAVGELTRKIAQKEETSFAIVMCDINHLKTINDTYGHQVGDKYIKNCSRLICKTYAHSPVYRIGGDEFAIILMGEDYDKRNELIDDIGERIVKAGSIDSIENGKASMAVGMSVYNPYTDFSVASVTKRADDSMYMNKRMMEYEGSYK